MRLKIRGRWLLGLMLGMGLWGAGDGACGDELGTVASGAKLSAPEL